MTYDELRQPAIDRPWIPVIAVALYLTMTFVGQTWMQNKAAWNLKWSLLMWNAGLAFFSICATVRYTSILLHQYRHNDVRRFFCFNDNDPVSGFWFMLFVGSKFVEFGDTFFLIVRKRKIMFLHWYHHTSVLFMAWMVFVTKSSVGPFYGGVNVFIHSLMYTYYALQTIGVRIPKVFSMILTTMQILQMIIGIIVTSMTHVYLNSDSGCNTTNLITICGYLMYASYFVLFVKFFTQSYFSSSKKKPDQNQDHLKKD